MAQAMACAPVLSPGLFCHRGRASLDQLVALGRPALLRLRGDGGEAWAVLLGADALRVRLWLGGGRVDVDRLALDRAWRGEFAVIWRGPAFIAPPIGPGASGPGVDWVLDRLRDRTGLAMPEAGPAVLDDGAIAAVKQLQAAHGLAVDGLLGPETLLALSSRDEDGPQLRRSLD